LIGHYRVNESLSQQPSMFSNRFHVVCNCTMVLKDVTYHSSRWKWHPLLQEDRMDKREQSL
jgi:hypothetical protein